MSETIAIQIGEPPDFVGTLDELSAALHLNDLRSLEDVPPPGTPWPDGIRHLFRDGVSTRTTEITCGGGEFAIRMFSMASREDVDLAVALAEYVAAHAGVTEVASEQAGGISVDELATYYDATWTEAQQESGYRAVSALIRDGRGPIEIPGPNRSFCIGPRVLLQLGPAKSGERPAHLQLLAALRHVQWIPVRTAGTFVATARSDNRDIKLAMWLGEEVVFPNVDFAGIAVDPMAKPPQMFLIPASRVPELAGDRWTPIDERQGILADCSAGWPSIVEAARAFATTP